MKETFKRILLFSMIPWAIIGLAWALRFILGGLPILSFGFLGIFLIACWSTTVLLVLLILRVKEKKPLPISKGIIWGLAIYALLIFAAREGVFAPHFTLNTDWYRSSFNHNWNVNRSSNSSVTGSIESVQIRRLPLSSFIFVQPVGQWDNLEERIRQQGPWSVLDEEDDGDSVHVTIHMPSLSGSQFPTPFLKKIHINYTISITHDALVKRGHFDWDSNTFSDDFATGNLSVYSNVGGTLDFRVFGFCSMRTFKKLYTRELEDLVMDQLIEVWETY